ncbi:MAG: hypothetical protein KTR32_38130 [Granulosicoccus sp.]|nr:hypothetical protein [Granulosicoccus sp.]
MKREFAASIVTSATLGALLWCFWPFVERMPEPWAGDSPHYYLSLATAGLVTGFLFPRQPWAVLIGVVMGQIAYELAYIHVGPTLLRDVLFSIGLGILAVAAAFTGAGLRHIACRIAQW